MVEEIESKRRNKYSSSNNKEIEKIEEYLYIKYINSYVLERMLEKLVED